MLQECLRIQSETPPRSALAAFFGRSPLHEEASGVYVGALGQFAVSSQLRELGPGWTILQTVQAGTRAQVGHLVIGPPGVFSVTTVVADGRRASVSDDLLTLGRRRTAELPRARAEAERAAETLSAIAGAAIVVAPIVAIVGASIVVGAAASTKAVTPTKAMTPTMQKRQAPGTAQTVPAPDVLSSNRLVRWLSLRPTTLTSAAVVGISTIASTSGWQVVAPLDDDGARRQHRFERLCREVEIAKSRRRGWIITASAALASGITVSALATLGVVTGTALAAGLG